MNSWQDRFKLKGLDYESERSRHYGQSDVMPEKTAKDIRCSATHERNRTREETRTFMVCPAPAALRKMWVALNTIGRMDRTGILGDATTKAETSYFITSLPPRVTVHSKHIREHWRIEHKFHHTLDLTFAEDSSRIRKGMTQKLFPTCDDVR